MRLRVALALLGVAGCGPALGDDDDVLPVPEDCPDEDLYPAVSCEDTYCGAPAVRLGTGGSDFMPLSDGGELDVYFGPQGGYHMFLSAEMEQLCPIVFLELTMDVYVDGRRHEFFNQTRHVQAVRPLPDQSSLQQYWGIQGLVDCNLYPDDPDHDLACGTFRSRVGHIEDFEVTITLRAEDHDGRMASEIKTVQPVCCSE